MAVKRREDAAIARAIATARKKVSAAKRAPLGPKAGSAAAKSARSGPAKVGKYKKLSAPPHVPKPRVRHAGRARSELRPHRDKENRAPSPVGANESSSDDDDDDDDDTSESEAGADEQPPSIDWPAAILIAGKKFAGKTNLIRWLMEDEEFDNVFLFTITAHKNNLNDLASSEEMILETVSDKFFEALLEHQKETNASTLLIFDDVVGMRGLGKQMPVIKQLAASCRNFNLSIVFATQDVTEVATTFRRNAEYFFLGHNVDNANELLAKQLAPPILGRKAMLEKLRRLSEDNDHEFFFIDERTRDFDTVKAPLLMGA